MSQSGEVDRRVQHPEVVGVGGDDLLLGAAGAEDDVSIHDVGLAARSEEPPNVSMKS